MTLAELAEELRSGNITVSQWETSMRDFLRSEYETALILAKGGRDNITFSDWGYEGSLLKKQYQYLSNFAKEISANPTAWMSGRLDTRMKMYGESAYAALEDFQRREAEAQGYTEEIRHLHATESCPDCIAAGEHWEPIGSLPPIGDSVCIVNCVIGETKIQSPEIEIGYKRIYSGDFVELFTANGRTLTVTPNHPLLTDRGWVRANGIKNGDNLACAILGEKMPLSNPDINNSPAEISKVFTALEKNGHVGRVMGSELQFHSDGKDGYVDIVFTNRLLMRRIKSALFEPFHKNDFSLSDLSFPRHRSFYQGLQSILTASSCFLRSFSNLQSFLFGKFRHSNKSGFVHPANRNIVINESLPDNVSGNAETFADGLLALSTDISFDKVIHLHFRNIQDVHVYNLQSIKGWYTCNEIITHNCKCTFEYRKGIE
jgi:hypothetical protein